MDCHLTVARLGCSEMNGLCGLGVSTSPTYLTHGDVYGVVFKIEYSDRIWFHGAQVPGLLEPEASLVC